MKRIFSTLMVAAIATAVSCIKEQDITTSSEPSIELSPMTFGGLSRCGDEDIISEPIDILE